jgi:hypothetical protein
MRHGSKLPTRRHGVIVREGVVKIGPNEPCPLGRALKYKKCCGASSGLVGWWRRRRCLKAYVERQASAPPSAG